LKTNKMDIYNILLLITAGLNLIVGIFVLLRGIKEKVNIFYFIFSLSMVLWCVSVLLTRYFGVNYAIAEIGARSNYFTGLLTVYLFYIFTYFFPYKSNSQKGILTFFNFILFIYFVVILYFTDLFITGVDLIDGVIVEYHNNQNFVIYALLLAIVIFCGMRNLYMKLSSSEGIFRKRLVTLLWVAGICAIAGYYFDLVLPFIGVYFYIWLGPLFLTLMALAVARMIIIENK